MKHVKVKTLELRGHKVLNEKWIHDVIAADPSLLGIGDVFVKDRERIQVGAGRLDLLLQETEGNSRYEMEIQLGETDPSHIIRTLEYWDRERRRYPQYEHTAILIAEDVTSRFLNVIGLFNGAIPIMAIKMTAVEQSEGVGLIFTRVVDTVQLGLVDEDEGTSEPADRKYWETRASAKTVKLADAVCDLARTFSATAELSYSKAYIGFRIEGKPCNFATSRPQKSAMVLSIQLPQSSEIDKQLEKSGVELLDYDIRWKNYRIRLSEGGLSKHKKMITALLKLALERRSI